MRILTNMERIAQEFRVKPRFACTEATSLDKNNVSGITVRPDSTYAKNTYGALVGQTSSGLDTQR